MVLTTAVVGFRVVAAVGGFVVVVSARVGSCVALGVLAVFGAGPYFFFVCACIGALGLMVLTLDLCPSCSAVHDLEHALRRPECEYVCDLVAQPLPQHAERRACSLLCRLHRELQQH